MPEITRSHEEEDAALTPFVRNVPYRWRRGLRPRRHWRQCYERALRFMRRAGTPDEATLVHGLYHVSGAGAMQLPDGRVVEPPRGSLTGFGHAWVELPGDMVFDGVRQAFYDLDGYYTVLAALPEVTYSAKEAMTHAVATGHAGPWHESPHAQALTRWRNEVWPPPPLPPPDVIAQRVAAWKADRSREKQSIKSLNATQEP